MKFIALPRLLCVVCSLLSALLTLILFADQKVATAQDISETISGEGISGEIDKKRRSPTVSVNTLAGTGTYKLIVDAYIAASEYKKFPIEFEFYVNKVFFTSQYRPSETPGAISVDIPASVATPPFTYTIIARTLHPNREFTTVLDGNAFSSNLQATLDCTLTTAVNSDSSVEYIANNVSLAQGGNDLVTIAFETDSTPEGHSVDLTGTATITDLTATASFTINEDDAGAKTVTMTGDVEKDEAGDLISLDLSTEDGGTTLSCL